MAQTQYEKKTESSTEEHTSLKGTLVSVFIVGLVIIITWVGVYSLFLNRL